MIIDPIAALVAVPDTPVAEPRGLPVVDGDDPVYDDDLVALVAGPDAPDTEPRSSPVVVAGAGEVAVNSLVAPVALDVVECALGADPQGVDAAL